MRGGLGRPRLSRGTPNSGTGRSEDSVARVGGERAPMGQAIAELGAVAWRPKGRRGGSMTTGAKFVGVLRSPKYRRIEPR